VAYFLGHPVTAGNLNISMVR